MPQMLPTLLSKNTALSPTVSSMHYQKDSLSNQHPLEQPGFAGLPLVLRYKKGLEESLGAVESKTGECCHSCHTIPFRIWAAFSMP